MGSLAKVLNWAGGVSGLCPGGLTSGDYEGAQKGVSRRLGNAIARGTQRTVNPERRVGRVRTETSLLGTKCVGGIYHQKVNRGEYMYLCPWKMG